MFLYRETGKKDALMLDSKREREKRSLTSHLKENSAPRNYIHALEYVARVVCI